MADKIKHTAKRIFACGKPWYQRWWIWLFALMIISAVPIAINESYKIGKGYQTLWEAKDVLSFYGSFLAFVGTVGLGALSLWQNYTLSQKNDQYNVLMQKIEKQKNLPTFVIDRGQGCSGTWCNYWLEIKNLSTNSASNINVTNFNIFNVDNTCIASSVGVKVARTSLAGGESVKVDFTNDKITGENLRIVFNITYTDKFGERHVLIATGFIINCDNFQQLQYTIREEPTNDKT